jgi:hypothetical protein
LITSPGSWPGFKILITPGLSLVNLYRHLVWSGSGSLEIIDKHTMLLLRR